MYVARILYPVQVLGPGRRVGIWFAGCRHQCKGCCNPELWEFDEKYDTSLDVVMQMIHKIAEKETIEGFTISGGDPFEQPEALNDLLDELRKISEDIIVYTGYEYTQLPVEIVKKTAVIIDGKYIEEKNQGSILKGSENQNIMVIDSRYKKKYEEYFLTAKNEVQNFHTGRSMISVGIHKPTFRNELRKRMEEKGLEET